MNSKFWRVVTGQPMKLHVALLGTALCVAAFTSAQATVVPLLDSVTINIGDQSYTASSTTESKEFLIIKTGTLPTNFSFTPGVVYLTEPGTSTVSDVLVITKVPISTEEDSGFEDSISTNSGFKLVAAFVSDGEKGLTGLEDFSGEECKICKNSLTLPETGSPQDVSAVFGLAAGSIFIQSDVESGIGTGNANGGVPELSTWAMMLFGFAAVGFVAYRRTKKRSVACAAA